MNTDLFFEEKCTVLENNKKMLASISVSFMSHARIQSFGVPEWSPKDSLGIVVGF